MLTQLQRQWLEIIPARLSTLLTTASERREARELYFRLGQRRLADGRRAEVRLQLVVDPAPANGSVAYINPPDEGPGPGRDTPP